jgi:ubiquinone/menaquinone biosynthesis C-methylase UbiE
VAYQWGDYDHTFVARRYDRLARLIPFFEWLLFLPRGLRQNAVERLALREGSCVLEVGCGTGRNLPFLRGAVQSTGRIYGVDLSSGMLAKASDLCEHHRWSNVTLIHGDALDYDAPEPLDAALFSLSYNTIRDHVAVLHHVWRQLRPGGTLVIMDAKLPPGSGGQLILPFSLWLMRWTMLGNPLVKPWEHVATLNDFDMNEFLFGSYYVCWSRKPALGHIEHGSGMLAAE